MIKDKVTAPREDAPGGLLLTSVLPPVSEQGWDNQMFDYVQIRRRLRSDQDTRTDVSFGSTM